MGLFNKSNEANGEKQVQTVKLTDLLASAAIATVQAGASASMEYYKNLCNIGFERYDPNTNTVNGMRTLTFEYPYDGKMEQEVVDSTTEATDVLNVTRIPNLRVTLLPSKKTTEKGNGISPSGAGLSVHMTLKQSDMPGGMARFLQVINNLDYRILPDKPVDDSSEDANK